MAKCLQKLGASPVFITNAGPGDSANLDVRCPHSSRNAATYMAVFDQSGECKIGLGDMKAHDTITPELVANNISALEDAPLIVMDGNIPLNTMAYVLKKAEEMGKPVFFEPTDIRKATKPFQTNLRNPIKFISPNLNELKAIGQFFGYNKNFVPDNINSVLDVGKYISKFVDNSIITMGKNGVLLVRKCSNSTTYARHYEYQSVSKIVNVSGAGDCLASGFILALLTGAPEEVCISVAFEAATMSVMDEQSVPENMFNQNHPCWTTKSSFKTLM